MYQGGLLAMLALEMQGQDLAPLEKEVMLTVLSSTSTLL